MESLHEKRLKPVQPKPKPKKKPVMKQASPMKERFCTEYIRDYSLAKALRRAGYTSKTASLTGTKMLKDAWVQNRLAELEAEVFKIAKLDAVWVISRLQIVTERCLQVKVQKDGNFKFDPTGATRALELLGKSLGLFKDKVEVDVKGAHEKSLDEMANILDITPETPMLPSDVGEPASPEPKPRDMNNRPASCKPPTLDEVVV